MHNGIASRSLGELSARDSAMIEREGPHPPSSHSCGHAKRAVEPSEPLAWSAGALAGIFSTATSGVCGNKKRAGEGAGAPESIPAFCPPLSPQKNHTRPAKAGFVQKSIPQRESRSIMRASPVGRLRSTNSRSVQETRFERDCLGEEKKAEGLGGKLVSVRASTGNADKALNAHRNPSVAGIGRARDLAGRERGEWRVANGEMPFPRQLLSLVQSETRGRQRTPFAARHSPFAQPVSSTHGPPGAARTLHVRAGCTRQTARGALGAPPD